MEKIEMTPELVNKFFGNMDAECLEQVRKLEEHGDLLLDARTGELFANSIGQKIYTDYFKYAFFKDDECHPYQVGDTSLCIASRMTDSNTEPCQYICIEQSPQGSDGWDLAQAWDVNSETCYGPECRVYQLYIQTFDDEWDCYPIWFENRDDAIISNNE